MWKDFYRKKVKEKRNKKGVDIHTLKIPCVPVYVCMFSTADLEIRNVPNPLKWYYRGACVTVSRVAKRYSHRQCNKRSRINIRIAKKLLRKNTLKRTKDRKACKDTLIVKPLEGFYY